MYLTSSVISLRPPIITNLLSFFFQFEWWKLNLFFMKLFILLKGSTCTENTFKEHKNKYIDK